MMDDQVTKMICFIGVDLAWSPRNRTGAAAILGDARGGTVAAVELPLRDWREGGHALADHPDVQTLAQDGDLLRFEIGSGRYDFTI